MENISEHIVSNNLRVSIDYYNEDRVDPYYNVVAYNATNINDPDFDFNAAIFEETACSTLNEAEDEVKRLIVKYSGV